jgi:acyl CoA:acetate/3-ketoacid CoA transferase beta subunit
MLTPAQLARRAARELAGVERTWVDPRLALQGAPSAPGPAAVDGFGVALVRAEWVTPTGQVACDASAAGALAAASRVVAVMPHLDDEGRSRIVDAPKEGATHGRVQRIITDLCVIDVTHEGLIVREVAPGVSAREVQKQTQAPLLAGPDLTFVEA